MSLINCDLFFCHFEFLKEHQSKWFHRFSEPNRQVYFFFEKIFRLKKREFGFQNFVLSISYKLHVGFKFWPKFYKYFRKHQFHIKWKIRLHIRAAYNSFSSYLLICVYFGRNFTITHHLKINVKQIWLVIDFMENYDENEKNTQFEIIILKKI